MSASVTPEEGARRFRTWTLGIFGAFRAGLDDATEVWKLLAQSEARGRGAGRKHASRRMWQTIVREPARLQAATSHGQNTVRVSSAVRFDGEVGGTWYATLRAGSSDVPYARIQELGGKTNAHPIRARRAQYLRFFWKRAGHVVYFKRVNHPGSTIPARPYMGGEIARRAAAPMTSRILAGQLAWAKRAGVM